MFIAALLITAKNWKQPSYPSIGKWKSKLWYIQTMEYYSAINIIKQRNELSKDMKGP